MKQIRGTMKGLWVAMMAYPVLSFAQTIVAPGDTGSIIFPLENRSSSDGNLKSATIDSFSDPRFQVTTPATTHTLPPGTTWNFQIDYQISPAADDGPFVVTLAPNADFAGVASVNPNPNLLRQALSFIVDTHGPQVTINHHDAFGNEALVGPFDGELSSYTWLHNHLESPQQGIVFNVDDIGGISRFHIEGPESNVDLAPGQDNFTYAAAIDANVLKDGLDYAMTATDVAGHQTNLNFSVDSRPPVLEPYRLRVGEFALNVKAVGTAKDLTSGVRDTQVVKPAEVALHLSAIGNTITPPFNPGANVAFERDVPETLAVNQGIGDGVLVSGDASGLGAVYGAMNHIRGPFTGAVEPSQAGDWRLFNPVGNMGNLLRTVRLGGGCAKPICFAPGSSEPDPRIVGCEAAPAGQTCGEAYVYVRSRPGLNVDSPGSVVVENFVEDHGGVPDTQVMHVSLQSGVEYPTVQVDRMMGKSPEIMTLIINNFGDYRPWAGVSYQNDALFGGGQFLPPVVRPDPGLDVKVDFQGISIVLDQVDPGAGTMISVTPTVVPVPPSYTALPENRPAASGFGGGSSASGGGSSGGGSGGSSGGSGGFSSGSSNNPASGATAGSAVRGSTAFNVVASNFAGAATITMPFDKTSFTPEQSAQVRMMHFSNGGWQDMTSVVDVDHGTVRGVTTSFSPFGLFMPLSALGLVPSRGLALQTDPAGSLWEVSEVDGQVWITKHAPYGVLISSAPLEGGSGENEWSLSFDSQGRAYAVAAVPSMSGSEIVVYQVAASGDSVLRKRVVPTAAGEDFAFDSTGDVWMTGAFNDGTGTYRLGLWHYCPHGDSLERRGEYARGGGTDAGFGVRLDEEKNVWVAGFSLATDTAKVDLGLWKFNPQGTAVVAGPYFVPAMLSSFENRRVAAKLAISTSGLYAVANTQGLEGDYDLATVKFGYDGQVLNYHVWRSSGDQVPESVLVDRDGRVRVAGNVDERFGLWTYDAAGDFVAAQTIVGAPIPKDVTENVNGLWFAIDNTSAPYHLTDDTELTPLLGSDVVISSQGAPAAADTTAPITTVSIGVPRFTVSASTFVSPATLIGFTAQDDASGVNRVEVAVDTQPFAAFTSSLTLAEGLHTLLYKAFDNAGNTETAKTLSLTSDGSAPATSLAVNGQPAVSTSVVATSTDVFSLSAADAGAGVFETRLALDGGPDFVYSSSGMLAVGTHTLSFFSTDNLGNAEAARSYFVTILSTVPAAPQIAIAPSSGPIGIPFSIAGTGFGTYNGSNTRVRFGAGGPTASISVWNDTTITGTVPGLNLVPGDYAVAVERQSGASVTSTPAGTFSVRRPVVDSVVPSSGPIGISFSLFGADFGPYNGSNTKVLIGGATTPISVWNDHKITGTVPGGLEPGTLPLIVRRVTGDGGLSDSATAYFELTMLYASSISASSGPIGIPFTITGTSFGTYNGSNTRVKFGSVSASISVWNDALISGIVPGIAPGDYAVAVERQQGTEIERSNEFTFSVTLPQVDTVAPSSGPIGTSYTLSGASFGPYNGSNTKVLIGGATSSISVWNDHVIKGTIPGTLQPANHPLIVQRVGSNGVLAESATQYFQVTGIGIASISPSSGPIGISFSLSGTSFGAYNGSNTRVKFGTTTASISVWNDTAITGTVPGLGVGVYDVVVERQQGSGVSQSNTGTFEVLAPAIASLSPSTGPIGIPFAVSGTSFGTYNGSNTRVKFGATSASISVWNNTTITGTVPGLPAGTVAVVVERQTGSAIMQSNLASFAVQTPQIASLTPSSGPIGAPFTLQGSGFGPYNGSNTRVKIGGALVSVSVWNDTTISGRVPGASPSGEQPLVVERVSGSSLMTTATIYFTVGVPTITAISPAFGPTGTAFTLSGDFFGPYNGSATKVKVGGTAASVSSWGDHTIRAIVPSSLANGTYDVVVELSPSGGTTTSNAIAFTVGTGLGGAALTTGDTTTVRPAAYYQAGLLLTSEEGGRVEAPSRAAAVVPAGALAQALEVTVDKGAETSDLKRALALQALGEAGPAVEFGPHGTQFGAPVTLELPYAPSLVPSGKTPAVHYWNAQAKRWEPLATRLDASQGKAFAQTDHFSTYKLLVPGVLSPSAASDAFTLHAAYAFPNPARGKNVTIRAQVGLADSVEVKVYDVSGRLLHEGSFGQPSVVDDGNGLGPQWSYDHVWDTSQAGTGVYLFVIKAKKSGAGDIRTSGKAGVIK
jgi:hypothetical protein